MNDDRASDAQLARAFGDYGISLLAYNYLEEAEEAFRVAELQQPLMHQWPYYLGHVQRRRGRMLEAATSFQRAVDLDPFNIAPILWVGESYLLRDNLDDAAQAFEAALELDRHCGQAWTGLGKVALSRGDLPDAIERLETALEHTSGDERARFGLATAYRRNGRLDEARRLQASLVSDNYSAVLTCFEDPWMQAVRERQVSSFEHDRRAQRARNKGQLLAAIAHLRQVAEATEGRHFARYDIADMLRQLRRLNEARAELELLLQKAPDYAPAHALLGRIEYEAGNTTLARRHLERSIEIDPQLEDAYFFLGEVESRYGDLDIARRRYSQALELTPDQVASIVGYTMTLLDEGRPRAATEFLSSQERKVPHLAEIQILRMRLQLLHGYQEPAALVAEASAMQARAPSRLSLDLLALSLAAAGNWSEAASTERQAIATTSASGLALEPHSALLRARLEAFEKRNRPSLELDESELNLFRNPWLNPAARRP